MRLRIRMLWAALAAVSLLGACAPASQAASERPAHFWRTATQAISIADRQPSVERLHAAEPGARAVARPAALGLWQVVYREGARTRASVLVEDRTGHVLEPSPWAWPDPSSRMTSFKLEVEIGCALLGCIFLLVFFDFRRPFSIGNLDVVALLSLGASLAFYDRGEALVSVPLVYPPLLYLLGRLAIAGFRGARPSPAPASRLSDRALLVGLVAMVVLRIGFNLAFGETTDVAYASVLGANSIHHGWPLYSAANNHLDTYGPVTYLAYLPFELAFPMRDGWQHNYLPAAHAAAITFDLVTMLGLFLLGHRMRGGDGGRRLGLILAFGWAAYPFTFMTLAINTNDGLISPLVVFSLVALSSPRLRGALLGLAAAAKFAPLALLGVLAAARGDRRMRSLAAFGLVFAAVAGAAVYAYLPEGGLRVFWNDTLGFQMHRHSFLSIWGQYPALGGLRSALQVAAAGLAAAAFLLPRRRTTTQVAALAGAILICLELTLTHWFYTYVVWFFPLVMVGLAAARDPEPAAETAVQQDRRVSREPLAASA